MRARRLGTMRQATALECSLVCEEKPPTPRNCDNRGILPLSVIMIIARGGGTAVEPFLSAGAVTGGARAMAAVAAAGLGRLWVVSGVCVCPAVVPARPRAALSPSPRTPLSPNWCAFSACGVASRLGRASVPSVGAALWGLWRWGVVVGSCVPPPFFPCRVWVGGGLPPCPGHIAFLMVASQFCAAARFIYFCVVSRCSCPSIALIVVTFSPFAAR